MLATVSGSCKALKYHSMIIVSFFTPHVNAHNARSSQSRYLSSDTEHSTHSGQKSIGNLYSFWTEICRECHKAWLQLEVQDLACAVLTGFESHYSRTRQHCSLIVMRLKQTLPY